MTDNLARLRQALAQRNGDMVAALRQITGLSTTEMCQRMDLNRTSLYMCLRSMGGRRYEHVRRALETELGLPAYSLDELIT